MKKITATEASFCIPTSEISKLKNLKVNSNIVGQDRAVSAIKMGLGLKRSGFNIFVMGLSGTGRRTAIAELLKDYKPNYAELMDIAYVYNFKKRLEPDALFFPGGEGPAFKTELNTSIAKIITDCTACMRSESYLTKVNRIINESNTVESELLINFEIKMKEKGFKFIQIKQDDSPASFDLTPLIDGKETGFQDLKEMVEQKKMKKSEFNAIKENYYKCMETMNELFDSIKNNQDATQNKLYNLLQDSIKPIVAAGLKPVIDKAKSFEKKYAKDGAEYVKKITDFLQNIEKDIQKKAHTFITGFKNANQKKRFLTKYDINLVCENSADKNYVITENLPTFANLFGTIENTSVNEISMTDAHMRISPGAVHRANGGFLILRFEDLLTEENTYFYLKRVLQAETIEIQIPPTGNNPSSIFKPVAIPATCKIILIGDANSYDSMYQTDPDFPKLFKICAEFSPVMLRTEENEAAFIALIDKLTAKHGIPKMTTTGYARLIEYACKLSGSRKFLSTQFAKISDILVQAAVVAEREHAKSLDAKIISQTLDEVRFLSSLPEQEYLNELKCGIIFLQASGKKVGSINGLAVQDRGYFSFGVSEVITAQSSPGESGVINIETEVGFSGEIYDKAHLIISSLLKNTYAKNTQLSVDASICFEQSYGMIEGDSASCAEFLALLSSLSNIPFRQDLAITGSLNQHGDVQPIGGVSEKIQGFFTTCKIIGFTGTQGVVIPEANIQDLFLNEEISQAIREKKFFLYAVKHIDEAVKLFADCRISDIEKAVKQNLQQFNQVMRKLVKIEKK